MLVLPGATSMEVDSTEKPRFPGTLSTTSVMVLAVGFSSVSCWAESEPMSTFLKVTHGDCWHGPSTRWAGGYSSSFGAAGFLVTAGAFSKAMKLIEFWFSLSARNQSRWQEQVSRSDAAHRTRDA